jgi:hypothetical protein
MVIPTPTGHAHFEPDARADISEVTIIGQPHDMPTKPHTAPHSFPASFAPRGFTTSDLAGQVHRHGGHAACSYTARRAAYDLKKFRGKQIVRRIGGTGRYEPVASGLKTLAALIVLRHHVIKPLLAAAEQTPPTRGAHVD